MWWLLPREIIDNILHFVSFQDYVSLTQTNQALRSCLNDQHSFLLVVSSNFGSILDSYALPISICGSKLELWIASCKLSAFLDSVEKYETSELSYEGHKQTLQDALDNFASGKIYFVPLIAMYSSLSKDLQEKACIVSQSDVSIGISKLSWTRKLIQLQNFSKCVEFFRDFDPDTTSQTETCYLQLARCYIDFIDLAPFRQSRIKIIRTQLRSALPLSSGILSLRNMESYKQLLNDLLIVIMQHLKSTNLASGSGGNILRIYKGIGRESRSLYLSILAKLLKEEVFDKVHFVVAGVERSNISVAVSPMFLILDTFYVLVDLSTNSWHLYSSTDLNRLPSIILPQAVRPIKAREVIQRAFEANENDTQLPPDFASQDWTKLSSNTSNEKLRLLRTILIPVSERKGLCLSDFTPLLHKSDFVLYFYCAQAQLGQAGVDIGFFTQNFIKLFHGENSDLHNEIKIGDVVANRTSGYLGVTLGHLQSHPNPRSLLRILPFDNLENAIASSSNISKLGSRDFGPYFPSFITWLLSTEGMSLVGIFKFSWITISSKEIRFEQGSSGHQITV